MTTAYDQYTHGATKPPAEAAESVDAKAAWRRLRMARPVVLCRADLPPGADPAPAVTVQIGPGLVPSLPVRRRGGFFASEGSALARVLWENLPAATIDALMAGLAAYRARAEQERTR